MRSLLRKRVLITGAGRGIGRELARRFAAEGCYLLLTDIDPDPLRDVATLVRAAGGAGSSCTRMDVTSETDIAAARERILARDGAPDVLVNNAGIMLGGAFLEQPMQQHRAVWEVNTLGLASVTHAFLPDLIGRPESHLVNIASASALIGLPFGSSYGSSKWAVAGFSDAIRLELRETGRRHVGVTTVCPGYVDTDMVHGVVPPRGMPLMRADQIAARTVAAVKAGRPWVLTPWLVRTVPLLRGILPSIAFDAVSRLLGASTGMRGWRPPPRD